MSRVWLSKPPKGGGGKGGTPLYKLYKYVPPHQVEFLCCFGPKKGIHFADFGLESGMVFEGTTGVYEGIYHKLLQFQMTKKEREIWEFKTDLKNFFVCALI